MSNIDELLKISDLPAGEQEPFSRWLRGSDFYFPHMYEDWKAVPDKVCRECGKGWYSLIDDCEKELAGLGVENKHWTQIKEKFGGLRLHFTTDHLPDDVAKQAWHIAEKYIRKAGSVCMRCGSEQGITTENKDYVVTLCQRCHGKRNAELQT